MKSYCRFRMLAGTVLLAACTAQDDQPAGGAADTTTAGAPAVPAAAEPADGEVSSSSIGAVLAEWHVTLSQDSVPAGPVTIGVANEGTIPHAFEVEGNGEEFATDPLAPGESVTMSIDLAAGEYRVYCPVESAGTNHEAQGMVTRLRVY
ncbi:MAG: hypothetical protein WEF86_07255 [Gemmatimonadota bacterium]